MTRVPANEINFEFVRSSGPGGQNVNKTATKVIARWSVGASRVFSSEEKSRLRQKLASRLTNQDELVVAADTTRSQLQNRGAALVRLNNMVHAALVVPKSRRPTRPTRASKLRNAASKRRISLLKKLRTTFE